MSAVPIPASAVPVPDWWDVFCFADEPVIECPDCYVQSPPLRDVRAAALWVRDHYRECPA